MTTPPHDGDDQLDEERDDERDHLEQGRRDKLLEEAPKSTEGHDAG